MPAKSWCFFPPTMQEKSPSSWCENSQGVPGSCGAPPKASWGTTTVWSRWLFVHHPRGRYDHTGRHGRNGWVKVTHCLPARTFFYINMISRPGQAVWTSKWKACIWWLKTRSFYAEGMLCLVLRVIALWPYYGCCSVTYNTGEDTASSEPSHSPACIHLPPSV